MDHTAAPFNAGWHGCSNVCLISNEIRKWLHTEAMDWGRLSIIICSGCSGSPYDKKI